jgi:hypothetical protein
MNVMGFSTLQLAFDEEANGYFSDDPMNAFIEDKLNPGSFIYDYYGRALVRYNSLTKIHTTICGSLTERGRNITGDGPALDARFYLILDFGFKNEDTILITDFYANCIKKYDSTTDSVSVLIGQCNADVEVRDSTKNNLRIDIQNGKARSASSNFLEGPLQIIYAKSRNYYLVVELAYSGIYKVDADTMMVDLLIAEDINPETLFPDISQLLLSPDEAYLYVHHSYALSRYDMTTGRATVLVGEKVSDGGKSVPKIRSGSFTNATVGSLASLQWLIPGHIIISAATISDDSLALIDLDNEELFYFCTGE